MINGQAIIAEVCIVLCTQQFEYQQRLAADLRNVALLASYHDLQASDYALGDSKSHPASPEECGPASRASGSPSVEASIGNGSVMSVKERMALLARHVCCDAVWFPRIEVARAEIVEWVQLRVLGTGNII